MNFSIRSNRCNYHDRMSTLLVDRRIQNVDNICSYKSNHPNHIHELYVYQLALNLNKKKTIILIIRFCLTTSLTLIHWEFDNLFDFSTKWIFDTFLMVSAFNGQIFWWYILGATCIVVTIAFIATNGWTYWNLYFVSAKFTMRDMGVHTI